MRGMGCPRIVHSFCGFRAAFASSAVPNFRAGDQFAVGDALGRDRFLTETTPSFAVSSDGGMLPRLLRRAGVRISRAVAAGEGEVGLIEIRRMRLRSGRCALIRRERGVALNQRHAIERDAEFFGDQLRLRGVQAVAQFALAGVRRYLAVGSDGDPGIELIARSAVDALRGSRCRRQSESGNQTCCSETHDEGGRTFHELTARDFASGFIVGLPARIA